MENNNALAKLMGIINKIGTAAMMNLVFLVCCLPVVTVGAAWSGLYSAIRFSIRKEDWFAGFKAGLRANFLRNTITWCAALLVGYYALNNTLYYGEYLFVPGAEQIPVAAAMALISGLFLLAILVFCAVAIPMNLYVPTNVQKWISNTWDLALHAPLQALGATILMWLPLGMALFFTETAFAILIVFVAAYFALAALLITILLKDPLLITLKRERAEAGESEQ